MIKEYFIKNMVCDRCIKVVRNELLEERVEVLETIIEVNERKEAYHEQI